LAVNRTNYGSQILNFDYHQEARAKGFNQAFCDVLPYGVYTGGQLSRVSSNTIQISPLVCVLRSNEDDFVALRIQMTESQNLIINPDMPYIVLRFGWADVDNVFMDIRGVGWSINPLEVDEDKLWPLDIILGKVQFSGVTINASMPFDLSKRKDVFLKDVENAYDQLKVSASEVNSKRVHISGGWVNTSKGHYMIVGGEYPGTDIPDTTTMPRTDLIVVDAIGSIRLIQGVPSAQNPAPTPKYGTYRVLSEIRRGANRTNVLGSDIIQNIDASRRGQVLAEDFPIVDAENYLPANSKNIEAAFNYIFHHSPVLSPSDTSVLAKILRKHIKWGISEPDDVYAGSIPIKDAENLFLGSNIEAVLAEIAGKGRTSETLKGLADDFNDLAEYASQIQAELDKHIDDTFDNNHIIHGLQVVTGTIPLDI
jgi:hypothetical protein